MTGSLSPGRVRLVSALAFGVAGGVSAVLVGLGLRWLLGSLASMSWGDASGLAFIWALPCIVAGAIVGPMVARQASVRRAAGVGVLATAAAAFVQAWFAFAIGAGLARDLTGEPPRVLLDPALWLNALILAVAVAPLGALAGWAVWRTVRGDIARRSEA